MKPAARKYQAQNTGAPEGWVYRVRTGSGPRDYVDFDGFDAGILLETKGPNIAKFINDNLEPRWFFEGTNSILLQAAKQLEAANGVPVRWIVAERRLADYLRMLFDKNKLGRIEVIHIPAQP